MTVSETIYPAGTSTVAAIREAIGAEFSSGPIPVHLEAACLEPTCSELAWRMQRQLDTPKYTLGVALLPVPDALEEWRAEHRTARKRADRATRLGYRFDTIDRSQHNDEIHEINTSLDRRQGRPMSDGYLKRHNHGPLPAYPCHRHRVSTYGVLQGDRLVAYLSAYRVGELLLVSMILGHADHLQSDCMYALWQGVVADQAGQGGVAYYNRWDSGQDGLRYFKSKLGFREGDVEWVL